MDSDDTQTAAEPAFGVSVRDSKGEIPTSIGRYRLVRILGEGGMGSVHEAWDNELERRVALKILRGDSADRARLLHEARAMAKVDHDAVITIYDAATADNRDFIAMELVDGDTLGHWVERTKPAWREIVRAYVVAGHGLAAAHDAGLVHRDFKPSNVLRSRTGRIAVADFGLARPSGTESSTIAGTPKYMAPEQWDADDVAPAADQYSLCAALWEALAGEMPPAGAHDVPRALRSILKRGMAEKPGDRWPSMRALLAALESVLAFRRRAAIGAAILAAAGVLAVVVALRGGGSAGTPCGDPPISPDVAWSPDRAAAVRAASPQAADLLASDFASWSDVRATACKAEPSVRAPQIACLDVVMQYLDVAAEGVIAQPPPANGDGLAETLTEPELCAASPPPGLKPVDASMRAAILRAREASDDQPYDHAAAFADAADSDHPCTQMLGVLALYNTLLQLSPDERTRLPRLEALEPIAVRCGDEVLLSGVSQISLVTGDAAALVDADRAAKRLPIRSLQILLAKTRGDLARDSQQWDEAFAQLARAEELAGTRFPASRAHTRVGLALTFVQRGAPGDPEKALAMANELRRSEVPKLHKDIAQLLQEARWRVGDIAGADSLFPELSGPAGGMSSAAGMVVDEAGAPVADAEVGTSRTGDAAADGVDFARNRFVSTTTKVDGTFSLVALPAGGVVGARKGDRVAIPQLTSSTVRLVLLPTGTVSGRLRVPPGYTAGQFDVRVRTLPTTGSTMWVGLAPVKADGTFELPGVPRVQLQVLPLLHGLVFSATQARTLDGPQTDLALDAHPAPLTVIAHTDDAVAPAVALVFSFVGSSPDTMPMLDMMSSGAPMNGAATPLGARVLPPAILSRVRTDDLVFTIRDHDPDKTRACAAGFSLMTMVDLVMDPFSAKTTEVRCVNAEPGSPVIEITLPPVKRRRL